MRIRALAALAFALSCGAADAQQPPRQPAVAAECSDDRGRDRCSAEQHRQMLALYGLEPIDRLRDQGAQVRRIFYVDGYGRDLIALSFTRPRGSDPEVTVHFPRRDGAQPAEPMRALLPGATWRDVLRSSAHFDRRLAPRPQAALPDGEISVCLHAWVYTAEAADPELDGIAAGTRRAVGDACGEGLVDTLATALADIALPLFPPCAALDPERHRGPAGQLAACRLLEGDRHAAAEAMNASDPLTDIDDVDGLPRLRYLFLEDAVLDWNGERIERRGLAEAWLDRKVRPARTTLYLSSYRGESADRVRARGTMVRRDTDEATSEAPVEITWHRTRGYGPRVERITVGAFTPMRPQGAARR